MRKFILMLAGLTFLLTVSMPGFADSDFGVFEAYEMPGMPTGSVDNVICLPDGDLLILGLLQGGSPDSSESVIRYNLSSAQVLWRYDIPYTSEEGSSLLLSLSNGLIVTQSKYPNASQDGRRLHFYDAETGLHSEIERVNSQPYATRDGFITIDHHIADEMRIRWYNADNALSRETYFDAPPHPFSAIEATELMNGDLLLMLHNDYYAEGAETLATIILDPDGAIRSEKVHYITGVSISSMVPYDDGVILSGFQYDPESEQNTPFLGLVDGEGDMVGFQSLAAEESSVPILLTWQETALVLVLRGEASLRLITIDTAKTPILDALTGEDALALAAAHMPLRDLTIPKEDAYISEMHAFLDAEGRLMIAGSIRTPDMYVVDQCPILMPFDEIPLAE